MQRNVILVICAAVLCAAPASASRAASQSVNPVADAFVRAAQPDANFGAAGAVALSPPALAQGEYQGVICFDLAPVKAAFDAQFGAGQWTVQSASLRLTTTPANNPMFNPNAAGQFNVSWMQNDSWVEGTGSPGAPTSDGITFNALPAFLGPGDQSLGAFAFPGGNSGNNTYSLTLANGIGGDILGGTQVSLRVFAADNSVAYLFSSRNFGTVANRPVLTIDAVPEPAVGALLGAGALLLMRRRNHR